MAATDKVKLISFVLFKLAQEYATRGWVMQLHIGAERFTTSRLRSLCGPAGGYATIGNVCDIRSLCDFWIVQNRLAVCLKPYCIR